MIRVVLFLIVVGALSLGVAWLADRPGDVVIVWQGLRIETSLMVLGASLVAALVVLALLWSLIRTILRSPGLLSRHMQHRRGVRAYEAISNGLIAVGAGDIAAAQKHSAAINRLAPSEPLALLLNAQSAQLSGDREGAERTFRTMASRADTKPLGLHGLYIEARRRNDAAGARAYAEEAVRTAPSLGWASRAVLEFALPRRRLGRRAALARAQHAHVRADGLSAPARRVAHRARPRHRRYRSRQRQDFRARSAETRRRLWCRRRRSPDGSWPRAASCAKPVA